VDSGSGNWFALFQESDGSEGAGSLSQLHQDFNLPSSPTSPVFSFRYRFVHPDPGAPSSRPPDSVLAFLLDPGDNSRLVGQSTDEPNLRRTAFLWSAT
jgi:hypothetical protein